MNRAIRRSHASQHPLHDPALLRDKSPATDPQRAKHSGAIKNEFFRPFERLRPISAKKLTELNIAKPAQLWSNRISAGQLGLVFGWRGTGKSTFMLALALAMATGAEFLGFAAKRPAKVILLDGEMDLHSMQKRLQMIRDSLSTELTDNLKIMSSELFSGVMPKPTTAAGQQEIDKALGDDWDVLIIDNYSSFSSGREDADAWAPWVPWLLGHKRDGRTVILVHHTGKNGNQRGASNHEDAMDFVMSLRPPKVPVTDDALEFVVSWTKARHLPGSRTKPFQVALRKSTEGRYSWEKHHNIDANPLVEEARRMKEEGRTLAEVGAELGRDKSTIQRWLKR
jgi:putative DNA primase/helicase